MLLLNHRSIRILRHPNKRPAHKNRPRKRPRHLKQIPSLLQSPSRLQSNMERINRCPGLPRQNHRPGLGDIPRPSRPINRKRRAPSGIDLLGHVHQSAQSSARRTSLRSIKSKSFNHPPRPLPIEVRRIHHHHAAAPVPPHRRKNASVPKCCNASLPSIHPIIHQILAQRFKPQSRPNRSDQTRHHACNHRDLRAPPARKLRQSRIVEYVDALASFRRFRFGRFAQCAIV